MISAIKTPGVYINEINAFPPSIAQVATAIPAFVGYTENGPSTPTKIRSLLEYDQIFGGAPKPAGINITLNVEYNVTESQFKLYNSLRLFYANGGGECYIVSIGHYKDTATITSDTDFNDGIDLLEKVDEVTLLLFPDATNLGDAKLGLVQKHALMQCASLMDRFTIMDIIQETPGTSLDSDSEKFRDAIGNQNLKYGAAYYPDVKASFGYDFRFNEINGTDPGKVDFATLYSADADITSALSEFAMLNTDINADPSGIIETWKAAIIANPKVSVAADANVAEYLENIFGLIEPLGDPKTAITHVGLEDLAIDMIDVSLKPIAQQMPELTASYGGLGGTASDVSGAGVQADFVVAEWGTFTSNGASGDYPITGTNPYTALIESSSAPGTADLSKTQAQLDKLFGLANTNVSANIYDSRDIEIYVSFSAN